MMPWGDRTGPDRMGPRTGRGLGFCAGFSSPGYTKGPGMGRGLGRGFGRGRGGGRGFGRFFGRGPFFGPDPYYSGQDPYYPPRDYYGEPSSRTPFTEPTKEEEASYLKKMAEGLEKELVAIKERLKKLAQEK